MPKPQRRIHEPPRSQIPLAPERTAEIAFVYDPTTARLIAPWRKGPLHFLDEAKLLTVLALVDRIQPTEVCWIWSDPTREPVPVRAERINVWLTNWADGRASYITRRR
jgi:hypothetical protein